MLEQKYDLEDRLLGFAASVVQLTEAMPNTRAANHVKSGDRNPVTDTLCTGSNQHPLGALGGFSRIPCRPWSTGIDQEIR
jgi:hypothetical protein